MVLRRVLATLLLSTVGSHSAGAEVFDPDSDHVRRDSSEADRRMFVRLVVSVGTAGLVEESFEPVGFIYYGVQLNIPISSIVVAQPAINISFTGDGLSAARYMLLADLRGKMYFSTSGVKPHAVIGLSWQYASKRIKVGGYNHSPYIFADNGWKCFNAMGGIGIDLGSSEIAFVLRESLFQQAGVYAGYPWNTYFRTSSRYFIASLEFQIGI